MLDKGAKVVTRPQRRLNSVKREVELKEILNLNEVKIIYSIFYSTWVSPIHVVLRIMWQGQARGYDGCAMCVMRG